jgi:hypothetical protein
MTLEACNRLRGTAWDGCKSRRSAPAKKEVDMLNSFKSKAPEKDKNVTANVAEAIGNMAQRKSYIIKILFSHMRYFRSLSPDWCGHRAYAPGSA